MFTPPPSPVPLPATRPVLQRTDSGSDTLSIPTLSLEKPSSPPPISSLASSNLGKGQVEKMLGSVMDDKRRIARRTRWTVLLVPAVLLLVGLSSRHLSRNSALSELESFIHDSPPLHIHEHDVHHFAHKRSPQTATLSNSATPSESSLVNSQTPSSTTVVPQTSQTIPTVPDSSNPPPLPTPFPQPYDSTGATTNLSTVGCQNFFTNMTQSIEFRQCRPLSLLEQFSSEFIQVSLHTKKNTSPFAILFNVIYLRCVLCLLTFFFFLSTTFLSQTAGPNKSHRTKHSPLWDL